MRPRRLRNRLCSLLTSVLLAGVTLAAGCRSTVNAASQQNGRARAVSLLASGAKSAREEKDRRERAQLFMRILELQSFAQDTAGVQRSLEELKSLSAGGGEEGMSSFYEETLQWDANTRARAGDYDGALKAAEAIKDPDGRDRVVGEIVTRLAFSGDQPRALSVAKSIKKDFLRLAAICAVGIAQIKAGAPDKGIELVRTSDAYPRVRQLWAKWEEHGPPIRDMVLIAGLMKSAAAQVDNKVEFETIHRLVVSFPHSMHEPQHYGYAAAIRAREGDRAVADLLLKNYPEMVKGHDPGMGTMYVTGFVLGNDLADARSLAAVTPRGVEQSEVYALIAEAEARQGNFTDALSAADRVSAPDNKANTLALIARYQAQSKDAATREKAKQTLEIAMSLAERTQEPQYRQYAWCHIGIAQAKLGDTAAARASFAKAWAVKNSGSGAQGYPFHEPITRSTVFDSMLKAGLFNEATGLAGSYYMLLLSVAQAQARAGDQEAARSTLKAAIKAMGRSAGRERQQEIAEFKVFKAMAKVDVDEAVLQAEQMPAGQPRAHALMDVAEALLSPGEEAQPDELWSYHPGKP